MKYPVIVVFIEVSALLVFTPHVPAQQHDVRGQVRGRVVDSQGKGIPEVTVVMEHEGKHPRKYDLTTDKKGGFIRVGIAGGRYKITFTKEGYKPIAVTVSISLGGLSEIPPVTMRPGDVVVADPPVRQEERAAGSAASQEELAEVRQSFARAVEAAHAGRLDEAAALYREALAIISELPEAHYNLGIIYEKKRDLANAEAEYRQAVELDPMRSDSYVSLARVLDASGDHDQASQLLIDAAALFEQDARFQFNLGIRSFDLSLTDEAEAAFKKVRVLEATNPEPLYYLGAIALQRGHVEDAMIQLDQYVTLADPDAPNRQTAKAILAELKKSPSVTP